MVSSLIGGFSVTYISRSSYRDAAGECRGEETRAALRQALIEKKLPRLNDVRQSLCRALKSQHPELCMMSTLTCSTDDESMRLRRSCLETTMKVCNDEVSFNICLH